MLKIGWCPVSPVPPTIYSPQRKQNGKVDKSVRFCHSSVQNSQWFHISLRVSWWPYAICHRVSPTILVTSTTVFFAPSPASTLASLLSLQRHTLLCSLALVCLQCASLISARSASLPPSSVCSNITSSVTSQLTTLFILISPSSQILRSP